MEARLEFPVSGRLKNTFIPAAVRQIAVFFGAAFHRNDKEFPDYASRTDDSSGPRGPILLNRT
jgi:hypothetical protein